MPRRLKHDVGSMVVYKYTTSWGVGEVIAIPWSQCRRVKFYREDGSTQTHNISVRALRSATGLDITYRDDDDEIGRASCRERV